MPLNAFTVIVRAGVRDSYPEGLKRCITLSNYLALILMILGLGLAGVYLLRTNPTTAISILSGASLFLIPILLNRFNLYDTSRILLCFLLPLEVLIISVFTKLNNINPLEAVNFFEGRFFILGSALIPMLIFEIREFKKLIVAMGFSFMALGSFDFVHEFFGVGYYQSNLIGRNYAFMATFYSFMTLFFMVGSMAFQKFRTEAADKDNENLIAELNERNQLLKDQKNEIILQNNEILAQAEELQTNQDQLVIAMKIIEEQKIQLENTNLDLESELIRKNNTLNEMNEELVKHNNELRQFSYTISHNLRGPIARMLGLAYLVKTTPSKPEELNKMVDHIHESASELDGLLRDLSKIIDIRNDIYKIREKVVLRDELISIRHQLAEQWPLIAVYEEDLTVETIYAIRPMLHSILYNLISNAIKYRELARPLHLTVRSFQEGHSTIMEVKDNGMGINMAMFGNDLFRMYKRFHLHTEGKGLGLYLVKAQAMAMGGTIEVESSHTLGSLFRLRLRSPREVEEQVVHESPKATILYHAEYNSLRLAHHDTLIQEDYQAIYRKCLEMLNVYKCRTWVLDLANHNLPSIEARTWFLQHALGEARHYGLETLYVVSTQAGAGGFIREAGLSRALKLKVHFFQDLEEAYGTLTQVPNKQVLWSK